MSHMAMLMMKVGENALQGTLGSIILIEFIFFILIYRATTQRGIWGLGLPRGRLMGGG